MPQIRVLLGYQQGQVFSLSDNPVIIGRHPKAQIVLHPDSPASRQHAEVYPDNGHWRVRDLGSVNGTELNGRRTRDEVLNDRDEIVIGDNVFIFEDTKGDTGAIAEAAARANPVEGDGEHNRPEVQALVHAMAGRVRSLEAEVAKAVHGGAGIVREMLTVLLAGGHLLITGAPGLAKTTMIRAAARAMGLGFCRVHFTPDLLPADLIGQEAPASEEPLGRGNARLMRGPIFTNVFLADELQRAAPKTRSVVLDAMSEGGVHALGRLWCFEPPFFVIAVENVLSGSALSLLTDVEADRFMFSGDIGYPSEAEEREIARGVRLSAGGSAVFKAKEIVSLRAAVADTPVCEHLVAYAVRLVRATRPSDESATLSIRRYVERGASPRAARHLVLAAKARAVVEGRLNVTVDDIQAIARPVLRHRLVLSGAARDQGVDADEILRRLLDSMPDSAETRGQA